MENGVESPLMLAIRGLLSLRLSEFKRKIVLHSTHKMNKMLISFLFRKEQEDRGYVSIAPELVRVSWEDSQANQALRDSLFKEQMSGLEWMVSRRQPLAS